MCHSPGPPTCLAPVGTGVWDPNLTPHLVLQVGTLRDRPGNEHVLGHKGIGLCGHPGSPEAFAGAGGKGKKLPGLGVGGTRGYFRAEDLGPGVSSLGGTAAAQEEVSEEGRGGGGEEAETRAWAGRLNQQHKGSLAGRR